MSDELAHDLAYVVEKCKSFSFTIDCNVDCNDQYSIELVWVTDLQQDWPFGLPAAQKFIGSTLDAVVKQAHAFVYAQECGKERQKQYEADAVEKMFEREERLEKIGPISFYYSEDGGFPPYYSGFVTWQGFRVESEEVRTVGDLYCELVEKLDLLQQDWIQSAEDFRN